MIANIIDNRERPYRWKVVNAVVEAVENDNACEDADQATEPAYASSGYDERRSVSVQAAVEWATAKPEAVTLYLYDDGEGI
jgi:hypothetical protein